MRVLYVSKALTVAAYRDKLRALGRHVDVRAVVPSRWGRRGVEPGAADSPPVEPRPTLLHGHNHFHLYRAVDAMLLETRPELVHIDEEPFSLATFQLVRRCRRHGLPALFFAWQNLPKRLPPPFGRLRAHVFRQAAGAIAGTPTALAVLRGAGYDGPAAIIPQFGVDPARFDRSEAARRAVRARLSIGPDAFVVGYGGRLVREKGVHLLIDAVARSMAQRSRRPIHLVLLGDGPARRRLRRSAARAGIAGRVHFEGHVASLEMPRRLSALDALALPSLPGRGWTEQFGRILIEAMACRVPVIGSDAGEIPNVIDDAGRIVPAADAAALAAVIAELREHDELRESLAHAGRQRVLRRFTNERIAGATAGFYRELATAGTGRTVPA